MQKLIIFIKSCLFLWKIRKIHINKHIENWISFLITNKTKAQTLLKGLDVELGFDQYIQAIQSKSQFPEQEFIFLLASLDIRAWRVIFDTETGLSSKSIKLVESENQTPFKEFEEDKKVSVYLYQNKIIPLINNDDSDWSDSQTSEELLNDEEIEHKKGMPKVNTDIRSFMPPNNESMGMNSRQDMYNLRSQLPPEINTIDSAYNQRNNNTNWQSLKKISQSQKSEGMGTPNKDRKTAKFLRQNYQKLAYKSISANYPPPGLELFEPNIPPKPQVQFSNFPHYLYGSQRNLGEDFSNK